MIRRRKKPDLEYVAAHYKLSPQSKAMAYETAAGSARAAKMYRAIRISLERELHGDQDMCKLSDQTRRQEGTDITPQPVYMEVPKLR